MLGEEGAGRDEGQFGTQYTRGGAHMPPPYHSPCYHCCRSRRSFVQCTAGVHRAMPLMPSRCETDIFRALGLSYMPPHMREMIKPP